MIVVDTSALIAILDESRTRRTTQKPLRRRIPPIISAATLLVQDAAFQIENFTAQHVEIARAAYARYGKGKNAAGLNYGDCFSYALAKATGLPLLFKGQDFLKTDLVAALPNT